MATDFSIVDLSSSGHATLVQGMSPVYRNTWLPIHSWPPLLLVFHPTRSLVCAVLTPSVLLLLPHAPDFRTHHVRLIPHPSHPPPKILAELAYCCALCPPSFALRVLSSPWSSSASVKRPRPSKRPISSSTRETPSARTRRSRLSEIARSCSRARHVRQNACEEETHARTAHGEHPHVFHGSPSTPLIRLPTSLLSPSPLPTTAFRLSCPCPLHFHTSLRHPHPSFPLRPTAHTHTHTYTHTHTHTRIYALETNVLTFPPIH